MHNCKKSEGWPLLALTFTGALKCATFGNPPSDQFWLRHCLRLSCQCFFIATRLPFLHGFCVGIEVIECVCCEIRCWSLGWVAGRLGGVTCWGLCCWLGLPLVCPNVCKRSFVRSRVSYTRSVRMAALPRQCVQSAGLKPAGDRRALLAFHYTAFNSRRS